MATVEELKAELHDVRTRLAAALNGDRLAAALAAEAAALDALAIAQTEIENLRRDRDRLTGLLDERLALEAMRLE